MYYCISVLLFIIFLSVSPPNHTALHLLKQQMQVNKTQIPLENNVPKLVPVLLLKGGLYTTGMLQSALQRCLSWLQGCTWMLHCSVQSALMPVTCTSPVALTGTLPLSQGLSSVGHLTSSQYIK